MNWLTYLCLLLHTPLVEAPWVKNTFSKRRSSHRSCHRRRVWPCVVQNDTGTCNPLSDKNILKGYDKILEQTRQKLKRTLSQLSMSAYRLVTKFGLKNIYQKRSSHRSCQHLAICIIFLHRKVCSDSDLMPFTTTLERTTWRYLTHVWLPWCTCSSYKKKLWNSFSGQVTKQSVLHTDANLVFWEVNV